MSDTFDRHFGWFSDGGHVPIAKGFPTLSQAAPRLITGDEDGQPILLYKAWTDVLGKYPDYPAQQIGDCVSFGHGHGLDLLQCVEIGLGEPSEYRETDTEFIYGASREVSNNLGRWDGSYGAAAVKALTTVGAVSREMLGADGVYSGKRAKAWGYSGPPAAVKAEAAPYKLGSAAAVGAWDELVAAIRNGYPTTICSNQGFTLTRDAQGFCAAKGTWPHCMVIAAVRFDRPGALILQSWGADQPSGPLCPGQPSFSFWADRKVIERILSAGDSWALCKAPEFVKRDLPSGWSYTSGA